MASLIFLIHFDILFIFFVDSQCHMATKIFFLAPDRRLSIYSSLLWLFYVHLCIRMVAPVYAWDNFSAATWDFVNMVLFGSVMKKKKKLNFSSNLDANTFFTFSFSRFFIQLLGKFFVSNNFPWSNNIKYSTIFLEGKILLIFFNICLLILFLLSQFKVADKVTKLVGF